MCLGKCALQMHFPYILVANEDDTRFRKMCIINVRPAHPCCKRERYGVIKVDRIEVGIWILSLATPAALIICFFPTILKHIYLIKLIV
jgi:hypothetical protein